MKALTLIVVIEHFHRTDVLEPIDYKYTLIMHSIRIRVV